MGSNHPGGTYPYIYRIVGPRDPTIGPEILCDVSIITTSKELEIEMIITIFYNKQKLPQTISAELYK